MPTIKRRVFGCHRDTYDPRDYIYAEINEKVIKRQVLPPKLFLISNCSPVLDQGNIGSCTLHASVAALEFLEIKDKIAFFPLSRLFGYYNVRVLEGSVEQDNGATLADVMTILVKHGLCHESSWTYLESNLYKKPPAQCYIEAIPHKLLMYQRLRTLDDMKSCIAAGFPFVFGIQVYTSFMSSQVAATGIVPIPTHTDTLEGGHAVMAMGYDDNLKKFYVQNSWGDNWGMTISKKRGFFSLPYDYIANPNLAWDFWTLRRAGGV